jgi:hypothetical protein
MAARMLKHFGIVEFFIILASEIQETAPPPPATRSFFDLAMQIGCNDARFIHTSEREFLGMGRGGNC